MDFMKMSAMSIRSVCVLAIAASLSSPSHAVYRCTTDDRVTYQDTPCSTGTGVLVSIVLPRGMESVQAVAPKSRARAEADPTDDGLVAVPVSIKVPDKGKDQPSGPRWTPETPNVPVHTP
jgi:hypothetical protein